MFSEQMQWCMPLAGVPTALLSPSDILTEERTRSSSIPGQPQCQVDGCTAVLSQEEKIYCLKKRICSYHMRAEVILLPADPTQPWRFCFQCGKLEPLHNFDGTKKSCRVRLQRRKLPPRRALSWTAGHAQCTSVTPFMPMQQQLHPLQQHQPQQLQHNQMLLLEAQQQQQQQLLLNQTLLQQQQLQQTNTVLLPNTAAAAAAASGSAAAPTIQQRQQLLMQQLQQVHAAMAQLGEATAASRDTSPCSSSLTPASLAALGTPAGCAAMPSFDSPSTAYNNNNNSASTPDTARLSASGDSMAFRPAFAAALTAHTALAGTALSSDAMTTPGAPGQQPHAQAQGAASMAAAAAAAPAGSCAWSGAATAAAAPAAAASRLAPAPAAARVKRHKSLSALLAGSSGPCEDLQEDDLFTDMDVFHELDPFARPSSFTQAQENAFMEDLTAAFADHSEEGTGTAIMAAVPVQQQQQAQQQQVWSLQPAQAPPEPGVLPHVTAGMPGPVIPHSSGCTQFGTIPSGISTGHAGLATPPAVGNFSPAVGQTLGGMQGGMTEQHELQLQQLKQSIQVLQDSVQQLSMHIQQGGPAAATAAAAAGSAGNPGCAVGFHGLSGHPSM